MICARYARKLRYGGENKRSESKERDGGNESVMGVRRSRLDMERWPTSYATDAFGGEVVVYL